MKEKYHTIAFSKGDILIDEPNKEIGILLDRYDLFQAWSCVDSELHEYVEDGPVWVWDIFWVGSGAWLIDRIQIYTEDGLTALVSACILTHIKNI